jgi:hypothetical protein
MDLRHWMRWKLPEVIAEYVETYAITHVYGFFSRTTDYLRIMQAINWQQLQHTSNVVRARTYYVSFQGSGGAQVIVPQVTGKLIVAFIQAAFSEETFYENPFCGQYIDYIDHLST